jgi:hypothetical protein
LVGFRRSVCGSSLTLLIFVSADCCFCWSFCRTGWDEGWLGFLFQLLSLTAPVLSSALDQQSFGDLPAAHFITDLHCARFFPGFGCPAEVRFPGSVIWLMTWCLLFVNWHIEFSNSHVRLYCYMQMRGWRKKRYVRRENELLLLLNCQLK